MTSASIYVFFLNFSQSLSPSEWAEIGLLIVTGIAAASVFKLERNTAAQQRLSDLRPVALKEYATHEFPEGPIRCEAADVRLPLRAAKGPALRKAWESPEAWAEDSDISKEGTWQNRVAFETAEALENVGFAAFIGQVDVTSVLPFVGDVLVDDWVICEPFVKSYRRRDAAPGAQSTPDKVDYQRRHGEWIALAAAIYMNLRWADPKARRIVESLGGQGKVIERMKNIESVDPGLPGAGARKRTTDFLDKLRSGQSAHRLQPPPGNERTQATPGAAT